MPQLNTVSSLGEISLMRLVCHLSDVHLRSNWDCESMATSVVALRETLNSFVPSCLQERLSKEVLDRLTVYIYNTRWKNRRAALLKLVPAYLLDHVTRLNFNLTRVARDRLVLPSVLEYLPRMRHLRELSVGRLNAWQTPQLSQLISQALKGCSQLLVLRLEYVCTPAMLEGLSRNCPLLAELSVRDAGSICDADVTNIARCTKLRILDISGTSITGSAACLLLHSLTSLESFTHCPLNCNSGALLFDSREHMLQCIRESMTTRGAISGQHKETLQQCTLAIDNVWLFNVSTEELSLLTLFPLASRLRLDFVFQDLARPPDLSQLPRLRALQRLQLFSFDQPPATVLPPLFQVLGAQLSELELHVCADYTFTSQLDYAVMSECPALRRYCISGDYITHNPPELTGRPCALKQLQELAISGVTTDDRLKLILSGGGQLRSLRLDGDLQRLTDDSLRYLAATGRLQELRQLWVNVSCGWTAAVVSELLVLQPQSPLEKIGRISCLAASSRQIFVELKRSCRANNYQVQLVWVLPQLD